MNILWVNNIAIPQIAKAIGTQAVPVGGWMVKLAEEVATLDDVNLTVTCPYKKNLDGRTDKFSFATFKIDNPKVSEDNLNGQDIRVEEIIRNAKPDVIHIFGTEYVHSYVFSEVAKKIGMQDKVVISIQGLVSVYATHYYAFLPHQIVSGHTLRDFYKGNVEAGKKKFTQNGKLEIKALKNAKHIIGRTDWDRACTLFVNPRVQYHFNNEMLRDSFYHSKKWSCNSCVKHSVFLSQATMPLKGLHIALQAISQLKQIYSDITVRVAGKSYYAKKKSQLSYYEKYILDYITEHDLMDIVQFTGFLSEKEMVSEYLKANVFVSASSIENSPNSVCEAMMLGVPVVSSMVGGVANLLEHGKEGFYYQADAPYMLAYYVKQIFDDDELARNFSVASRQKAEMRHKVEYIVDDLIDIYSKIAK